MDAFTKMLAPRARASAQSLVDQATAQVQGIVTSTALLTAALTTVGVAAVTLVGAWAIRRSNAS